MKRDQAPVPDKVKMSDEVRLEKVLEQMRALTESVRGRTEKIRRALGENTADTGGEHG